MRHHPDTAHPDTAHPDTAHPGTFPNRPVARLMRRVLATAVVVIAAGGLLAPLSAPAGAAEPSIDEILTSVVKVRAVVPPDSRTAPTLGTAREGSGVVIDHEGLIVTIGYVILEAASVDIEVPGGRTVPATVLGYDHETGFGLLRAGGKLGVRPMEIGSSDGLEQRQRVLVASFGGTGAAIGALVVDRRDFAGSWEYLLEKAIFTSPPHPQFGGAALIDGNGRLVGIGSLIVPNAADGDTLIPGNMFIPIDALKPVLADLLAPGAAARPGRPWLGLYSEEFRGRLFVTRVPESGPAWAAGVRPGDIVLGVAGEPIESLAEFYRKVWAIGTPGVKVPLMVLRRNEPKIVTIESIDRTKWLRLKPTY